MQENKMQPNPFVTHGKTRVVQGTILSPEMGNLRLVFVPCSESGKPDTNLHVLLNKKWRTVAAELKGWYANHVNFKLGNIQTTAVNSDVWVVHALCLAVDKETGAVSLDEKALASCMTKLSALAKYEKGSIHVSNLTVNALPEVVQLLTENMVEKGIAVAFYNEPEADKA